MTLNLTYFYLIISLFLYLLLIIKGDSTAPNRHISFLISFSLSMFCLRSRDEETVLAIIGACRHRVLVIHATHFRPQHSATSRDPGPVRPVVEFAERGREISSRVILSEPCSFTSIFTREHVQEL